MIIFLRHLASVFHSLSHSLCLTISLTPSAVNESPSLHGALKSSFAADSVVAFVLKDENFLLLQEELELERRKKKKEKKKEKKKWRESKEQKEGEEKREEKI